MIVYVTFITVAVIVNNYTIIPTQEKYKVQRSYEGLNIFDFSFPIKVLTRIILALNLVYVQKNYMCRN